MALAHGPVTARPARSAVAVIGTPLAVLAAAGLMLAAMFLPVLQSSDATTTGYAIKHHQEDLADLNAQIHAIEADIAQLGASARIRQEAARLGMVPVPRNALTISVNQPAPGDPVLPRRLLPTPIVPPPVPRHGVIWSITHPLSPD